MSKKTLQVSDEIIFHTDGLEATILVDGEEYVTLGRDDLGAISEWLAAAWENVAGEEYRPVVITERGYVKQAGAVTFATAIEMSSDPGAYGESYGRESVLERDCE
ncbi:hypothetical protein SEA_HORTUS1_25 [Microbacterium phage Hortus1]|nr:hypothetical protein SEA_HORTUS1_25 [Microbacterium phage Hortus1]AWY05596.1 hypothetical protein SEA_OLINDD_25 [Microbacterium phage OlinDD]AWY06355.1 hypothetical protein SEA_TANDEM_25 [Microbacterium phage Tandem]